MASRSWRDEKSVQGQFVGQEQCDLKPEKGRYKDTACFEIVDPRAFYARLFWRFTANKMFDGDGRGIRRK
jgi:hypothetical protein